jgi:hypothetical protein
MAIFNSYVCLPEGIIKELLDEHKSGTITAAESKELTSKEGILGWKKNHKKLLT